MLLSCSKSSPACRATTSSTDSRATYVLPAPVGAHTSVFFCVPNTVGKTADWTRFSVRVDAGKQRRAHSGSVETSTSSPGAGGSSRSGGSTTTFSNPSPNVRSDPGSVAAPRYSLSWPSRRSAVCAMTGSALLPVASKPIAARTSSRCRRPPTTRPFFCRFFFCCPGRCCGCGAPPVSMRMSDGSMRAMASRRSQSSAIVAMASSEKPTSSNRAP
mmetsp:Transcript_9362/g.29850  ORF Transcript_9362/g.29850 Transcript_9362/m.29850 type:complete len:215 (+) Transcript_9362:887-1531(+)